MLKLLISVVLFLLNNDLNELIKIRLFHSVDSGFDHSNTKANIRTGPSAFALGVANQSVQKLFV